VDSIRTFRDGRTEMHRGSYTVIHKDQRRTLRKPTDEDFITPLNLFPRTDALQIHRRSREMASFEVVKFWGLSDRCIARISRARPGRRSAFTARIRTQTDALHPGCGLRLGNSQRRHEYERRDTDQPLFDCLCQSAHLTRCVLPPCTLEYLSELAGARLSKCPGRRPRRCPFLLRWERMPRSASEC
jgi:hypothetical protein